MTDSLTAHLVVPVANEDDAQATATALDRYAFDDLTVVHVVEHTPNLPDSIPVDEAEAMGEEAFDAFREVILEFSERTTYGTDVVEGICEVAADEDASAIAFHPRGGNRIVQFLSGDTTLKLVTEADRPVIALPTESADS